MSTFELETPFGEGVASRIIGIDQTANPYPSGSVASGQWNEGYLFITPNSWLVLQLAPPAPPP